MSFGCVVLCLIESDSLLSNCIYIIIEEIFSLGFLEEGFKVSDPKLHNRD